MGSLQAQSAELSLDQCLDQARANSPLLAQQPLLAEALAAKTTQLNRSYWPQLQVAGQATWQSDVVSVPIDIPGVMIPTPPQDQYRATLDLQQTLWDGGAMTAQKNQVESQTRAESQRLAASFYQMEGQIQQLFFGAILAGRQRSIAELMITDLQRQLARLEAAVENGVALPSSVQQLRAKLIELEQQQTAAYHRRSAALAALEQWTGEPISPETRLVLPGERALPEAFNRPDLALIDRQIELVQAGEQLLKVKNRPKIGLFASLGYGRPGLNFLSDEWDVFTQVGAQVQIPLSWLYTGSQRLDVQQLRVQQQQLSLQRDQLTIQAQTARVQSREEIARLRFLLASDQELVAIREELTAVAASQMANGTLTASAYLTELNRQELAQQNQLIHEIQLQQAMATYRWQSGVR